MNAIRLLSMMLVSAALSLPANAQQASPALPAWDQLSDAQRAELRDVLLALAADDDPEVRMQVARGLAQPRRPSEMKVLEELAADAEARVRIHAARSLVGEGITLGPAFSRLLRDGDLLVAQAAIESLGRVGTSEAKERLLQAMSEGPEWLAAATAHTPAVFQLPWPLRTPSELPPGSCHGPFRGSRPKP